MRNIFFARDKDGNDVSIFDVKSGLECGCTCLDCGFPLIAYKGNVKSWHFQHENFNNCFSSEETSLQRLVKMVLSDLGSITLPEIGYTVGSKYCKLRDEKVINIESVEIENNLGKDLRPTLTILDSNGYKLYLDVCCHYKVSKKKEREYKKSCVDALGIRFSDSDFVGCESLDSLISVVKDKLISMDYSYSWISNKELNELNKLQELGGISHKSNSGLNKVYCPQNDSLVMINEKCVECPFKSYMSKNELICYGNLTKEQLLLINPDVVFPPTDVNYAGKCNKCDSTNTVLLNIDGSLYRKCKDCNNVEEQFCPICGGTLSLKRNNDSRFDSFESSFIGCDCCSFTLTYTLPSGEFADEVRFTGGLDSIRKDKGKYFDDLIRYRQARRK